MKNHNQRLIIEEGYGHVILCERIPFALFMSW